MKNNEEEHDSWETKATIAKISFGVVGILVVMFFLETSRRAVEKQKLVSEFLPIDPHYNERVELAVFFILLIAGILWRSGMFPELLGDNEPDPPPETHN